MTGSPVLEILLISGWPIGKVTSLVNGFDGMQCEKNTGPIDSGNGLKHNM